MGFVQVRLEVVAINLSNMAAFARAGQTSLNISSYYLSLSKAKRRLRADGILMPHLPQSPNVSGNFINHMQLFDTKNYVDNLTLHYETYLGVKGKRLTLQQGPPDKLHKDFFILEFPYNDKHQMFCYCTVGMSVDRLDENLIELVVYSPKSDKLLVELLTVCASYHRNGLPLNLHHTVNIGQPWLDNSKCDHGFISLPYLDGEQLEIFNFGGQNIHCYWFIPITEKERDFKTEKGCEALEQLFEDHQFDYLNPKRDSLVV